MARIDDLRTKLTDIRTASTACLAFATEGTTGPSSKEAYDNFYRVSPERGTLRVAGIVTSLQGILSELNGITDSDALRRDVEAQILRMQPYVRGR